MPDNGFAYAVEADGKGARVMQSEPVLLPAFDVNSPDAKSLAQRLEPQVSGNLLDAYLAALKDQAGVSVNETLWQQISGPQTN